MGHIDASHLMDRNLFSFTSLQATGTPDPAGDRAFDDDPDDSAAPQGSVEIGIGGPPRRPRPAPTGGDSSW